MSLLNPSFSPAMEQVYIDIAQANVNLNPDNFLRQLASCRLANRKIHIYWCAIALSVIHPVLVLMGLLVLIRIRSKFQGCELHSTQSCDKGHDSKDHLFSESLGEIVLVVMLCVIHFLLVVLGQQLIMSGDVELNPGPLDGNK